METRLETVSANYLGKLFHGILLGISVGQLAWGMLYAKTNSAREICWKSLWDDSLRDRHSETISGNPFVEISWNAFLEIYLGTCFRKLSWKHILGNDVCVCVGALL